MEPLADRNRLQVAGEVGTGAGLTGRDARRVLRKPREIPLAMALPRCFSSGVGTVKTFLISAA